MATAQHERCALGERIEKRGAGSRPQHDVGSLCRYPHSGKQARSVGKLTAFDDVAQVRLGLGGKIVRRWKEEIEEALSDAVIAVLLISADFLASDFIVDNELPPILEGAEYHPSNEAALFSTSR